MSIITLDGVIEGMRPPEVILKVGVTMEAIGRVKWDDLDH